MRFPPQYHEIDKKQTRKREFAGRMQFFPFEMQGESTVKFLCENR